MMADVSDGGRIVPIVRPEEDASPDCPPPPPQLKSQQLPPHQEPPQGLGGSLQRKSSTRKTRKKVFEEAECLEIPCLNDLGLYALPTEGDGNCLYYALSDQLYGDFTHAEEIRLRLADHISSNPEYFMNFVAAVGGVRRAPRRAASLATKHSSQSRSPTSASLAPSAHETEQSFNSKVAESRKMGVWGGAEEIQACCQSYKRDIHVYTMYGVQTFRDVHAPDWEARDVLHIAFHDFHHYSSVRHTDGPHTGMPGITQDRLREKEPGEAPSTVVETATPWKIEAIQEGLGGRYDRDTIIEMLQACRGNIDRAFCNLLGEEPTPPEATAPNKAIVKTRLEPSSSRSTSPFSTGSKRSADDSDSEDPRPANRRHQRRPQRETKRRILPDVTVGIAFRDDQNDLVSLRLRVSPEAVAKEAKAERKPPPPPPIYEPGIQQSSAGPGPALDESSSPSQHCHENEFSREQRDGTPKLRRSRRSTRSRNSMVV